MLLLLCVYKQGWLAAMQTCSNDYNVLLQVALDARIIQMLQVIDQRAENGMVWYGG